MLIRFKMKFVGKVMGPVITFCLVLTVALFLSLPLGMTVIYLFCTVITFMALVYGFYRTRFEVQTLNIADGVADFSFINKSFFKRKDMKVPLSEIKSEKEDKIISLKTAGKQFAILRQDNVSQEEWKELNVYFA